MSEGRIWFVGIFCDRCGRQEAGDVVASSQRAAEDGLRVSLVAEKGWSCDAAGDVCARCRPVAAEAPTEAPAVPAPVLGHGELDRDVAPMGNAELWR